MRTFDIRVQDPKEQVADVRPFTVVSADSHAGPPSWGYIPYIDPQYRDHAETFLADAKMHYEIAGACGYPFGPEVLAVIDDRGLMRNGGEIGAYDPERRIREAEAEGIVAEILHPLGSVNST